MIILDEVTERTKHDNFDGVTLRNPQAAYTRSSSLLLPDYETSEAQHRQVTIPSSSKFRLDAKTWKTALFALCIYVFLTLTIAVPIIVLKSKHVNYNHPGYSPPIWPVNPPPSSPSPPPPPTRMATLSDVKAICNSWQPHSHSPNSVIASFQLPPTDCITISSNATYDSITSDQLNGTLSVSMNNNPNESSVLFTVEMQSSSKYIQDQTTVCFSEEGVSRGLSIFIPSDIHDGTLALDINVVLPRVNSNIEKFATSLPMFSQDFGDLRQYLSFDQFTLQGSHHPINCKSLQASQISVSNTLALIQGSFNVSDSLSLNSINGPIITDITLSPRPVQTQPTSMSLGTGNSTINASITLNAPTKTSIPSSSPVFAAQVQNFNGPLQLDVAYDNASLPSPFQLSVRNNVAPTIISMDSTFQGFFNVQTKLSQVLVHDAVDSQKNTSRTLDYDTATSDMAMGWIGWEPRPPSANVAGLSYIDALSALGPINLTFGP